MEESECESEPLASAEEEEWEGGGVGLCGNRVAKASVMGFVAGDVLEEEDEEDDDEDEDDEDEDDDDDDDDDPDGSSVEKT